MMLLAASSLAALGTPTQAGTEAEPEVTDPAYDHVFPNDVPAAPEDGAAVSFNGAADLRAAWFSNETTTSVNVTIKANSAMVGGYTGPQSTFVFRYILSFKVGETAYQATATLQSYYDAATDARVDSYTPGGVADELRVQGTMAILRIPLAAIGNPSAGAAATEIFVVSEARVGSATGTIGTSDRAPNTGNGLDYVFIMGAGGGPVAGLTHFLNVTTPVFNETVSLLNASSDVYQYNWTQGPANSTGSFNATGNGSVGFVITDANGTELINRTTTASEAASLTIPAGLPGNWNVRYTLYNFTGNFTLRIAPVLGNLTDGTGNGTGTGTGTSSGTGTGAGTSTSTGTGGVAGPSGNGPANLDEAIDLFKADSGYAVASAAGFASVLLISIIALASRWSL